MHAHIYFNEILVLVEREREREREREQDGSSVIMMYEIPEEEKNNKNVTY